MPDRIHYAQWFPLDRWLVALAMGWRVPADPVPALGHHGAYSILLVRDDEP